MHVRYALNIVVGTRTSVAVVSSFDTFQVLIVGCAGLKQKSSWLIALCSCGLQAGCPKLRGLFLANLSLNSTPKTNEKV